jgi:hypothetical protein
MTGTTVGEQERAVQIELDQRLPIVKAQLVDIGAGFRDDRAAADCIDKDVDAAEFPRDRSDRPLDQRRVERVAKPAMCPPPGLAQFAHRAVQPLLVVVDRHDDPALARNDVGRCAADAARRRGDQRHPVLKAHPAPYREQALACILAARRAWRGARCNSGFTCRKPAARRRRN